jgi:hypothetical protein
MANKLDERLDKAVEKTLNKMSPTVECLLTNQKEIQTTTSALSDMAETIKKLTHDMGNNVKAATETSDQLTNMVSLYKEALLNNMAAPSQQQCCKRNTTQVDLKILRDVDRKARQILINTVDPKIAGVSLSEIRDKVHDTINGIAHAPLPKDATILEINKLKKGGFIILLR